MRNIGFHGGHSAYELGPATDVAAFFKCLEMYSGDLARQPGFHVLSDRLYRRYLKLDELDAASDLLTKVRSAFAQIPSSTVDWQTLGVQLTNTRLDVTKETLAKIFAAYFELFSRAKGSAESFFESFKIYQPVKIVISDMPEFMVDKKRPLEQYDALEDKPFWLQ